MTTDTTTALSYYAQIKAALFPIPAGQKNPTGIVGSFVHDCSADPAQWKLWADANPSCNWGVVAGPSRLIIIDIDIKEGRDAAWAMWVELCAAWSVPVFTPQVESASGGWHIYFAVPENVDASTLRQPDAIKKLINVRAGNGYTVTAGSVFEGRPYHLTNNVAPYPAPQALVDHCTRKAAPATNAVVGSRDKGDVSGLLVWLNDHGAFAAYEDWVGAGMALKLEFGDDGLELWRHCHDDTVTADVEATKWQSFASEPTAGCQTLNSLLANAHKLGWHGSIRRSTADMFAGVAALAQGAGAQLSTPQGVPMTGGQEKLTELGLPRVEDFLKSTTDAPLRPLAHDYPRLPESMSGHGLYAPLSLAIDRMIAMAEVKTLKSVVVNATLSVLRLANPDVCDAVCRRINALGVNLNDQKIRSLANGIGEQVQNACRPDQWERDVKSGKIDINISDNVRVFLGTVDAEIRYNAWLDRDEIRGFKWPEWTHVTDGVVNALFTRARQFGTEYNVGVDTLWRTLNTYASENPYDPVRNHISAMRDKWDGLPRLSTWLTHTCGTPDDAYHQAVGRNIIGGMVRRALQPGCKHDTMAVLYGREGTEKSTLATILALRPEWFTNAAVLGEAPKELIGLLEGKLVAEIAEMGSRGSVDEIKKMLSTEVDSGRKAYARSVTHAKRRSIFIGSTNNTQFLHSATGNRRFMPVRVNQAINNEWLRLNIDQLVGEAATLVEHGETFWLPEEVWELQRQATETTRVRSEVETALNEHLAQTDYTRDCYITAHELTVLIECSTRVRSNVARSEYMERLGFADERIALDGKQLRVWLRNRSGLRPAEIPRKAVRYIVTKDSHGAAQVRIRAPHDVPPGTPTVQPLPPPPR